MLFFGGRDLEGVVSVFSLIFTLGKTPGTKKEKGVKLPFYLHLEYLRG